MEAFMTFGCYFIFIAAMIAGYVVHHLENQKKKAFWRTLAIKNNLTFLSGSLLDNTRVFGDYRGHYLTLDTTSKSQGKSSQVYTRIVLQAYRSWKKQPVLKEEDIVDKKFSLEHILHRLTAPQSPSFALRGEIKAWPKGSRLFYEQPGLEVQENYLQTVFDLLSELADIYPAVVRLGGEAVPGLRVIATSRVHKLRPLAIQLLQDIGQDTTLRLGSHISQLWCPRCLAFGMAHKIRLAWWNQITYYGCRRCGRSRDLLDIRCIAVLDRQMQTDQVQKNGDLRVNWLTHRSLFDFSSVEIVHATDEEVERLAVQVGNDLDPMRQGHYKAMPCLVASDCKLSPNTLRILARTFGQVERRARIDMYPVQHQHTGVLV
jgi:RNase P subunit RPR2